MIWLFFSFMILLKEIQRSHKLSIHFLCCADWRWDWWLWWPARLLFPQWLWVSWRRQCEQSQHQQHFKFLDAVDEELPEATGQHVLCLLVSPITNVGHQDLAPESSVYLIVHFTGFLPIPFNFDIISYKLISFWSLVTS